MAFLAEMWNWFQTNSSGLSVLLSLLGFGVGFCNSVRRDMLPRRADWRQTGCTELFPKFTQFLTWLP